MWAVSVGILVETGRETSKTTEAFIAGWEANTCKQVLRNIGTALFPHRSIISYLLLFCQWEKERQTLVAGSKHISHMQESPHPYEMLSSCFLQGYREEPHPPHPFIRLCACFGAVRQPSIVLSHCSGNCSLVWYTRAVYKAFGKSTDWVSIRNWESKDKLPSHQSECNWFSSAKPGWSFQRMAPREASGLVISALSNGGNWVNPGEGKSCFQEWLLSTLLWTSVHKPTE